MWPGDKDGILGQTPLYPSAALEESSSSRGLGETTKKQCSLLTGKYRLLQAPAGEAMRIVLLGGSVPCGFVFGMMWDSMWGIRTPLGL